MINFFAVVDFSAYYFQVVREELLKSTKAASANASITWAVGWEGTKSGC